MEKEYLFYREDDNRIQVFESDIPNYVMPYGMAYSNGSVKVLWTFKKDVGNDGELHRDWIRIQNPRTSFMQTSVMYTMIPYKEFKKMFTDNKTALLNCNHEYKSIRELCATKLKYKGEIEKWES